MLHEIVLHYDELSVPPGHEVDEGHAIARPTAPQMAAITISTSNPGSVMVMASPFRSQRAALEPAGKNQDGQDQHY